MNGFFCIVGDDATRADLVRRLTRRLVECTTGADGVPPPTRALEGSCFVAVATEDPLALRPLLADRGHLLAAGDVRLDNRDEVLRRVGCVGEDASDLEVVLAAYAAEGVRCIPSLLGDFGFAIWDERRGQVVAARDACGVKRLFRRTLTGGFILGSRAYAMSPDDAYDEVWIAEFLTGGYTSEGRTPFDGCRHVPGGTLLVLGRGVAREERYWSAGEHVASPLARCDERESVETFRATFAEAVRRGMYGESTTWAHLSGGLDSSSVVSMAGALHETGEVAALGGTITFVNRLGTGDETRYSDQVAARYGLRNEKLVDYWLWQDDGQRPPIEDAPSSHYGFWAREREMCRLVRNAGGRVLLSGRGGDDYLAGDPVSLTDLARAGRPGEAIREVTRYAISSRTSFWKISWEYLVLPFFPRALRVRLSPHRTMFPKWLSPAFAKRTRARGRVRAERGHVRRDGGHYAAFIAEGFRFLSGLTIPSGSEDGIEMRHPFLYRPLVELGLSLPARMLMRPGTSKWVLREAMRGILPEGVRTRRGKGSPDARILWSLSREEVRLREMLRDPLITQFGWVERDGLTRAYEQAKAGAAPDRLAVDAALALETWLRVKSGQWTGSEVQLVNAARAATCPAGARKGFP